MPDARKILADLVLPFGPSDIVKALDDGGYAIVPAEPTDQMVLAATASTASWQRIAGSALTVNNEKARIRYRAMVAAGRAGKHLGRL